MSELIPWLVTGLTAGLLLAFGAALISLHTLPCDARPRTRTYDRLGRFIELSENPDYHENPGENAAAGGAAPGRRH